MARKVDIDKLAELIIQKLNEEFAIKHLSKNLINTVSVVNEGDKIIINIPAQTYNMLEYFRHKVVIHTSNGSYASRLDEEGSSFFVYPGDTRKGSFRVNPRNHIGYINRVIDQAIAEWSAMLSEGKVVSKEG